jgi:myo-inositol-1(or 4)-monophosphatase
MADPKNHYLEVAKKAALKAGKILMASYGNLKDSQISMKSKNDFVTEVDKESEQLIQKIIRKDFPSHGIQGEESTPSRGRSALWIIDPLDGTSNYIHQFPLFSISIAVFEKGWVQMGLVYDPVHQEMFTAKKGEGAYLNGRRVRVSRVSALSDSLMATGFPFRARDRFDEYLTSFEKITLASVGMRRGGSAALDLAYVACGRFDGFWELDLSPWDIAAGSLLIEEAGGKISDFWGKADYLRHGDTLASNRLIHGELQAITSKVFTPIKKDKLFVP